MTDQPVQYDENTPPDDVVTNVVDPADETVEVSKNQEPVADLDEEV